jgi:hypothetical protein
MASTTEYFTFDGVAEWAFVHRPHNKFNPPVYMVNFYPKDDETRRAVKATGIRNGIKEGPYGWYYVFRRLETKGPPKVLDRDGDKFEGTIGNGSEVQVTLEVYRFNDGKNSGTGSRIDTVKVTKLVPYIKEKAPEAPAEVATEPKATKKVPF